MPQSTNLLSNAEPCCCSRTHLTPREIAVLREAAVGYSNAEIAKILNLSVHTIARYMTSMLHKAGERSRTALVNHAYRVGILTMGAQGPQATGRRCLPELSAGHPEGAMVGFRP
jgi:DNA-binding CsgD family transcriptional regulator